MCTFKKIVFFGSFLKKDKSPSPQRVDTKKKPPEMGFFVFFLLFLSIFIVNNLVDYLNMTLNTSMQF